MLLLSSRRFRFAAIAAFAALPLAAPSHAQLTSTWVSLDDQVGAPDHPFGLNVTPDGTQYHVAIAGSFSTPNNSVAVYDRSLRQLVGRYPVGLYPEEIAYTHGGGLAPSVQSMFVTNSTDSTVSVLDASGNPVTTIPLGTSNYPFGIAVSTDQRRLAVTTKNGVVFAIDASAHTVLSTIAVPGFHGRAVFLPDGRVAFGMSTFSQTVEAKILDLDKPGNAVTIPLYGPSSTFPSSEDVAVVADGRELWFPLMNGDRTIRRIDPVKGVQIGSIPLTGTFGGDAIHGIAASGEGHVLVTSLTDDAIALLETQGGTVLSTLRFALGNQPNDAVFAPDGREACVTMQVNQAGVHVVTGLPEPRLRLLASANPAKLGTQLTMTLRGAEAYSSALVALSITGAGPTTILGQTIFLSAPIVPVWSGTNDARGRLVTGSIAVPAAPALHGLRVYAQALVQRRDRSHRASDPLTIVLTK